MDWKNNAPQATLDAGGRDRYSIGNPPRPIHGCGEFDTSDGSRERSFYQDRVDPVDNCTKSSPHPLPFALERQTATD